MSRPSTIVFVPCFNEEGRIAPLLQRVAAVHESFDELVVVDDGSTDGSLHQVRSAPLRCTILRHVHRQGLGEAFRTAYRHTLQRGHRVFCVMAGNGKDDPAELSRMLEPVQQGRADYVQGSRFHPDGRSERLPPHRRLAIRAFTLAASAVFRRRFTDCSNGFRAYRTELLTDERIDWCAPWLGTGYEVETYLLFKAASLGYRVVEVPTTKVYPADGKAYSKANVGDWFRLFKPLLWCGLRLDRLSTRRRAPGEPPAGRVELIRPPE